MASTQPVNFSAVKLFTQFVQSTNRDNITSGESLPISFGKIQKFINTSPGEIVTGKSYVVGEEKTVIAGTGAEVFNDYENNIASGDYSHAEGNETMAYGNYSHAEGSGTTASGNYSHAEGSGTIAQGISSHASGNRTAAMSNYQTVIGNFNAPDSANKYAFIIGNGSYQTTNRSNAFAIDWYGNVYIDNATTGIDIRTLVPTSTYSSSGTTAVNGTAVNAALQTLNASQVGGTNKVVRSISETNGIISAVAVDISTTPTENLLTPITSNGVYQSQLTQDNEIAVIANSGQKNLLPLMNQSKTNINGVEFIVDKEAGTITVNADGTQTTNAYFYIINRGNDFLRKKILGRKVILTGCPEGGSSTSYCIRCWHYTGTSIARDVGSGVSFTFANESDDYDVSIHISPNTVCNNLVFKPMLRYDEIADDSYELYSPNNRELYNAVSAVANRGAKNLLYIKYEPGTTQTNYGRTYTVLEDGGIKITGATTTSSSDSDFYLVGTYSGTATQLDLHDGTYTISLSSNSTYSNTGVYIRAMDRRGGSTAFTASATLSEPTTDFSAYITTVFITVTKSTVLPDEGIIIYPMIRRAEIVDDTFVQYAPTNRELYETKAGVSDVFGPGTSIPDSTNLFTLPVGRYYKQNNVATLTNIPSDLTQAFYCVIEYTISTARKKITLYPIGTSAQGVFYVVNEFSSGYGSWYKFEGTIVS